jgi:integrase
VYGETQSQTRSPSLAVSLVREDPGGKRLYHKKIVGTVEQYPDETAVRRAVVGLLSEINTDVRSTNPRVMTIAQLCDHFEQRELSKENTWGSHATKKIYKAYLTRWVRPHWHKYELAEVRTIRVESWLRGLPLAKSSCAKIRNLMSVLFNHACRYELFDRNPIYLVRQSAKRRRSPIVLMPSEIKALVDNLGIRERTLVLLAFSTGLRQSELKWGVIDFAQENMYVTRSIVYGVVGPCKTESSQKPAPLHQILADALLQWRKGARYTGVDDWVFASKRYQGRRPYWGQAILRKYIRPVAQSVGIQKRFGWHTFRHTYSTLLRSVGTEFKGDAGTASTFVVALNVGCLHAGGYSGEACSASGRRVAGLFFRCERRITLCRTGNDSHIATQEKGTKRARNAPFSGPRRFLQNPPNSFGKNGGDDETRTRDLCRDS